jgi:hypothetical protein
LNIFKTDKFYDNCEISDCKKTIYTILFDQSSIHPAMPISHVQSCFNYYRISIYCVVRLSIVAIASIDIELQIKAYRFNKAAAKFGMNSEKGTTSLFATSYLGISIYFELRHRRSFFHLHHKPLYSHSLTLSIMPNRPFKLNNFFYLACYERDREKSYES